MRLCKYCKHWTRHSEEGNTRDLGSGDWGKPATYERGDCHCPKIVYVIAEGPTPPDGLGCEDVDGYWAAIETGPDFGCIHFEPGSTSVLAKGPRR